MRALLFFILIFLGPKGFSQDIYDTIADKLCKCIENEQVQTQDDIYPCFERTLLKNLESLLAHHNVKTMEELDGNTVGGNITGRLGRNCDYFIKIMNNEVPGKTEYYEPDSILGCEGLHTGEYFYLNPLANGELLDTTYVTFTDNEYFERMNRGRTYSRLKLEWVNECKFKLTFIESNDPFKNSMSKKGEVLEYEVIKNTNDAMVLEMIWHGQKYHVPYYKLK